MEESIMDEAGRKVSQARYNRAKQRAYVRLTKLFPEEFQRVFEEEKRKEE